MDNCKKYFIYEQALIEERKQGWRWAYFNFGDGDIQFDCPLANKLLNSKSVIGDGTVIANLFRSFIHMQKILDNNNNVRVHQCFILMDTFLLTISPAIGSIGGMSIPIIFNGLLFQIVSRIDAMFNAFHRDALAFVLPYCSRYDNRTWWTSQAILVYRSLCLYGHSIQFNAININRQKHRQYPRQGDPWLIDEDLNLLPTSYIDLKSYIKKSRIASPLVVRHYSGWSIDLTSEECRNQHTSIDPITYKVGVSMRQ